MPAGFWGSILGGTTRTLTCPHCGKSQTVKRQPVPFQVTCAHCSRPFRVTERGVEAIREH